MSNEEDVEVYVYNGVDEVPWDVTHVRVDPSVTIIPQRAFMERCKLEVVELPEGLIRIEHRAFYDNVNLKRINVPSTVIEIGNEAFFKCGELTQIVLPTGLQRLGNDAFANCVSLMKLVLSEGLREIEEGGFFRCTSLISISLPSSLKDIGVGAFKYCDQLNEVRMPDSIEIIQEGAFKDCNFTNFRVPSRVNNIDISILWGNKNLVSLELSTNLKTFTARGGYDAWFASISTAVLPSVRSLRNVTFPSECQVDTKVLHKYTDLGVLLLDKEGEDAILDVLKHRFDDLPIHKICYYQSYNNITLDQLNNATEVRIGQRLSKINPTGKEQDCLGMTPLHILACSTRQSVDMYRLLIDKYPETLIMKDKWGDIPLLYAFWCNAPTEVIDLLVESYTSSHPDYEFDWSGMLLTLAANIPLANIQKLINIQLQISPDYNYDMQSIIMKLSEHDKSRSKFNHPCASVETLRYLLRVSITKRLESLNVKRFCEDVESSVCTFPDITSKELIDTYFSGKSRAEVSAGKLYDRLATYESIKEGTSVLELALWKAKIDESSCKRARVDSEVGSKGQCRINCGADIVMRNVLPYLLPKLAGEEEEES